MPVESQQAQTKRPESVLVVVYTLDGKVLLMRRCDHPEFWQSITGSMDWDESEPRVTALRELREETGLDGADALTDSGLSRTYEILPQWRARYAPAVHENTEHAFTLALATPVEIRLNPAEHCDYRWVDFTTAQAMTTSWSNREAIALLSQQWQARTD